MTGSFHISLFEGALHVDKIHVRLKITNIKHAQPVLVCRQTDFTPKRVVISRQISYRSEILAPVEKPG